MRVARNSHQIKTLAALTLVVAAASILLFGGCDISSTAPTATPIADLPPLMVTACLDRTPSYDRQYFNDAKNMLADAIVERVTGNGQRGQQGAIIYVTLIGHNSYAPSATIRTIVALPTTRGTMASTPEGNNQFNVADARETATAADAIASATFTTAQNAALRQIQPDIAFLRSAQPSPRRAYRYLGLHLTRL